VQIVRDQRSGRSKGVGYVEFYNAESVLMAMRLTGNKLLSQEIIVQASQAEKNRAAAAAKFKKELQDKDTQGEQHPDGPMRISIEGFAELIENVTETDLYQVSLHVTIAIFSFWTHRIYRYTQGRLDSVYTIQENKRC